MSRNAINLSSNKNSPNDIGVQMTDKWIDSRIMALKESNNVDSMKTSTILQKARLDKKPINKIVVGVNDSRAVTLNLGQVGSK